MCLNLKVDHLCANAGGGLLNHKSRGGRYPPAEHSIFIHHILQSNLVYTERNKITGPWLNKFVLNQHKIFLHFFFLTPAMGICILNILNHAAQFRVKSEILFQIFKAIDAYFEFGILSVVGQNY